MKNIILIILIALSLQACNTQACTDNNFATLQQKKDSMVLQILNDKRTANLENRYFIPDNAQIDQCLSICDTLIANKGDQKSAIDKLHVLSISKRYIEFIEFGKSKFCLSCNIYPLPKVWEFKLDAMQCRLNKDKKGECYYVDKALGVITRYMFNNKATYDSLFKMKEEDFNNIIIKKYKANQGKIKAIWILYLYREYMIYSKGNKVWEKKFHELLAKYPNSQVLDSLRDLSTKFDIMDFGT